MGFRSETYSLVGAYPNMNCCLKIYSQETAEISNMSSNVGDTRQTLRDIFAARRYQIDGMRI